MYRADGTPDHVLFFIPRVKTRGYKMSRAYGSMRRVEEINRYLNRSAEA